MSTGSSTRPKLLVLVGPTASGKTGLLEELFAGPAGPRPGLPEVAVLSADSMQAYRGMDIGTAKPEPSLLSRLPHHLLDIREPSEQYTAGDFVRLAEEAMVACRAEGRLPVLSGGTGFYVRNLLCGLPSAPAAEPELRAQVAAELAQRGPAALREELSRLDPASAARIHENDHYRLTRALEIVRATGRPMADFAAPAAARSDLDLLVLGISRPRAELDERIEARVGAMFAAGLEEEVSRLIAAGYGPADPGMKAIGYREFFEAEGAGPEEIRGLIVRDTRKYARRQMTFFSALPGIRWIGPDPELLASLILDFLAA